MKHDEGYVRVAGPEEADDAVMWWFYDREGQFVFARGGRVRTARQARHMIEQARHLQGREWAAWKARPIYRLAPSGDLERLPVASRGYA